MIIVQFIEHPVVVSYFVKDAGQNLILPDVIICPFNRFNKTFLDEINITGDLAQYLELTYPGPGQFPFQERLVEEYEKKYDKYDDQLKEILRKLGNMSFNELMRKSAIDCSAFFQEEVCQKATTLTTSTGKCFRIKGKNQSGDGYGYGHKILITLPKHLYNPGINQMLNDGILVKLTEPNHGLDHDITFIPAGTHAIMPLSATVYDFIDDPPRYSCFDKGDSNYSRLVCFERCLTKTSEDICNCSLIPATNPGQMDICTPKQIYNCFYPAVGSFENSSIECRNECKSPCKYWKYSKTTSIINLSPEQVSFPISKDEIEALKNTILLEVFYTNLDYTLIKQMVAMTPTSFVAQLGGQMSLWIGGSLVSIVQFFIYLGGCGYAKLYRAITRKRSRKKPETNETNNHSAFNSSGAQI
ncbi:hypothetical protein FO519_000664 [Halicephalobus sp. NKZ332]|nr:hypothetical protein FO519_000664 [Halicephalobus sp. NKZ332]